MGIGSHIRLGAIGVQRMVRVTSVDAGAARAKLEILGGRIPEERVAADVAGTRSCSRHKGIADGCQAWVDAEGRLVLEDAAFDCAGDDGCTCRRVPCLGEGLVAHEGTALD
jgi:hypothetical protein